VIKPEEPEDRDPVWGLLARARTSEVNPHFARNVVRATRQIDRRDCDRYQWLRAVLAMRWRLAPALAIIILIGAIVVHHQGPKNAATIVTTPTAAATRTPEITDELGDQLASELAMLDEIDGLLEASDAGELNDTHLDWLLF
jgi:hypothetical protein